MEQRAQEQQFELLMLAADEVTPWLFDVATRTEIVNLLKVLLGDPPRPDEDAGGGGR